MKYFYIKKQTKFPVILHIPHNSTVLPNKFFTDFLVTKKKLQKMSQELSDWKVFDLFSSLWQRFGGLRSNISRMIVDMERFAEDKKEPMARVGMGVFYVKNEQGEIVRRISENDKRNYLSELYVPYHKALDDLTESCLKRFGTCIIIDCHTFPSKIRRSVSDRIRKKPEICIGADSYHTPKKLVEIFVKNFKKYGYRVSVNYPFSGTMVADRYNHKNKKVFSIMVEVNRGLYMDEKELVLKKDFEKTAKKINSTLILSLNEFIA